MLYVYFLISQKKGIFVKLYFKLHEIDLLVKREIKILPFFGINQQTKIKIN